VTPKGI
jgi:hypothetical protein